MLVSGYERETEIEKKITERGGRAATRVCCASFHVTMKATRVAPPEVRHPGPPNPIAVYAYDNLTLVICNIFTSSSQMMNPPTRYGQHLLLLQQGPAHKNYSETWLSVVFMSFDCISIS